MKSYEEKCAKNKFIFDKIFVNKATKVVYIENTSAVFEL